MKEGQIYKILSEISLMFAPGLTYGILMFSDNFTPFSDFERP